MSSRLCREGGSCIRPAQFQPTRKFNLRVYSEYRSLTQTENTILTVQGDVPVRLKDVAQIEDGHEELTSDVRVNGGAGDYPARLETIRREYLANRSKCEEGPASNHFHLA